MHFGENFQKVMPSMIILYQSLKNQTNLPVTTSCPSNIIADGWIVSRLTITIAQALGIIRFVALPSLTQLLFRLALAVPFWKSGYSQVGWILAPERYRRHVVYGRVQTSSA
jgi:hypothetical protein